MSLSALTRQAMNLQTRNAGLDAAVYCRALLAGGGDEQTVAALVKRWSSDGEASERARAALITKAAVATTGAELADDSLVGLTSAFLNSLAHYGAFDRMLSDGMIRVPLQARF